MGWRCSFIFMDHLKFIVRRLLSASPPGNRGAQEARAWDLQPSNLPPISPAPPSWAALERGVWGIRPLPILDAAAGPPGPLHAAPPHRAARGHRVGLPTRRALALRAQSLSGRRTAADGGGRASVFRRTAAQLISDIPAEPDSSLGFRRQLNPASRWRGACRPVPASAGRCRSAYLCALSAQLAPRLRARYWSAAHGQRE